MGIRSEGSGWGQECNLSSWPVPQANSFHTGFLTDTILPQKIDMVRLTRAGANRAGKAVPRAINVLNGAERGRIKGCGLQSGCSVEGGPMGQSLPVRGSHDSGVA